MLLMLRIELQFISFGRKIIDCLFCLYLPYSVHRGLDGCVSECFVCVCLYKSTSLLFVVHSFFACEIHCDCNRMGFAATILWFALNNTQQSTRAENGKEKKTSNKFMTKSKPVCSCFVYLLSFFSLCFLSFSCVRLIRFIYFCVSFYFISCKKIILRCRCGTCATFRFSRKHTMVRSKYNSTFDFPPRRICCLVRSRQVRALPWHSLALTTSLWIRKPLSRTPQHKTHVYFSRFCTRCECDDNKNSIYGQIYREKNLTFFFLFCSQSEYAQILAQRENNVCWTEQYVRVRQFYFLHAVRVWLDSAVWYFCECFCWRYAPWRMQN